MSDAIADGYVCRVADDYLKDPLIGPDYGHLSKNFIHGAVTALLHDVPERGISSEEVIYRPDGKPVVIVRTSYNVPPQFRQRITEFLTSFRIAEVRFEELRVRRGDEPDDPWPDMTGYDWSFPISQLVDARRFAKAVSERGLNPTILYHYTDEAGLRGIVSPSSWDINHPELEKMLARAAQLWASDVRYMNDSQELLFGAAPLVNKLRAAAADSAHAKLKATLDRLARMFSISDVLRWKSKIFAACFCESGHQVSQWQGYAGVGGYAIGFSWDALAQHSFAFHPESTAMGNSPFAAGLRRMEYEQPAAEAMADGVIDWLRSDYERPQDGGWVRSMIEGPEVGLVFLASVVLGQLAVVKHGDFKHEREWRLIAVSDPKYPAKNRQRDGENLPYLSIAVNMKTPDVTVLPPTIKELVVGPGPDQQDRIKAASQLLKARGHDSDVVVPYAGPLRR